MHTPMDNMIYSPSMNLVDAVIDEIALEGLDGITLSALWLRIAQRMQLTLPLQLSLMEQIWTICISTNELILYELESPRPPLTMYDRYEFVDPDMGTILEPDEVAEDIYEHCPIDDTKNGIRGSCNSYYRRKQIETIENLTLKAAIDTYGEKLVIVGSQSARQNALMGEYVCPTLELSLVQFCFLERVGRARYHGEITQGKRSLSLLKEDPKSLFYHRKYLLKHKLITKQTHYQRIMGHGTSGSLLHLPRFFVDRKPKMIFLAQHIVDMLKSRENCLADYYEIKKELRMENSIKKLFKTAFFQKIVKSDLSVPYRTLYPDAKVEEWQRKGQPGKEKMLRCVQLIDPRIDVIDLWNKDEIIDDEEMYDLDVTKQLVNVPILKQANKTVESTNCEGLSQHELGIKMGITKLQSRTILRNLSRLNIVASYMNDMGRQRMTKFVSKKFEKNSRISKQFQMEMNKMQEHKKSSNFDSTKSVPSVQEIINESDRIPKVEVPDEPMELEPEESSELKSSQADLKILFSAVNRTLKKYKKLPKRKYQITHQNLTDTDLKTLHFRSKKMTEQIKKNSLPITKDDDQVIEDNQELEPCDIELHEGKILTKTKGELRSLLRELNPNDPKTGNITYRILKRANMIIQCVKEHRVIDDTMKLMRLINEEEEREGYDVKIDKKSLIRLLQKLAMDNLVKNIKLTLSARGKTKSLTFICDPSIDVNHTVIQSAVEQARIKFSLMKCQKVLINDTDSGTKKSKKKTKLETQSTVAPVKLKLDASAGKYYGYKPKFERMKKIHLLLYYLIYDHPGPSSVPQDQQVQRLRARGYQIDDKMEKEMGEIYNNQVGWKMFLSPLPVHSGWPTGWALMCDILLRLPLSIFVKIHKIPYKIPDLEYYVEHPIRRHFLVKDLPSSIRNALLLKRKYIFSFYDTLARLCYIGLLQFGPQKLKEKDQVFIYLNKRSQLMYTISSAAGYHRIEEKSYPVQDYYFDKMQAVETYWYEMWNICINTQLGGRLAVQGTDIVLEELVKKPEMIETLKARGPEEAAKFDTGHMPGDKMGAAGIDSAFFSHLKRNWNWDNFRRSYAGSSDPLKTVQPGERNSRLSKIQAKPLKFTEFTGLKKTAGPNNVDANDLKVPGNKTSPGSKLQKHKLFANKHHQKPNTIVRRVLPRKKSKRTRVKYDDIDYSALQKMEKLRVDWDPREDNILLVCKVVMMYLCPNPRRKLISFTAVRDVLRAYSTSSYNKTSRACQRRLLYMLKQPQTMHSVGLGVEEIKENYYVNKRYEDILDKIRNRPSDPDGFDDKISEVFKSLVAYVAKKYYDISQSENKEEEHIPKTVQEFNLVYGITHPQKPNSHLGFTQDVRSINDIHTATINSTIYSSMCCGKDRRSWAYQLFRIYQQYSEILLRNAMGKIRADQMVSIKKHYLNAMKKFGNCLPMSSSQYQLSTSYLYKFQTRIPAEVYTEVFDFLMGVIRGYQETDLGDAGGIEILPPTGGMSAGIPEFVLSNKIDFNVELPDHTIVLDPKLPEYDETYIRIAKRYQDILRSLEEPEVISTASPSPMNSSSQPTDEAKTDVQEKKHVNVDVNKSEGDNTSQSVNKSLIKKIPPKNQAIQTLMKKSRLVEEQTTDYDYSIDEGKNDFDDDDNAENDYIRLQDGTLISITKEDIESAKLTPVDDHIHQAFLKTRSEEFPDFSATSGIHRINEPGVEQQPVQMEVDPEPVEEEELIETKMETEDIPPSASASKKNSNFVNDIIENMTFELESREALTDKDKDSIDVKRSSTRLALLRMTEELNDDVPDSHHAHEYFVVNTFGIFYSIPYIKSVIESNQDFNMDLVDVNELLMLEESIYKKVLGDLRKFAVFPREFPDYVKIRESWNGKGDDVDVIYEYVGEMREQGVTLKQLVTKFHKKLEFKLYDILSFLVDNRLFLRSGVTEAHYIHHNFVDPWLIQSMRIMRLHKEALPLVPPGTVYILSSDNPEEEKEPENNTVDENAEISEKIADEILNSCTNEQQKNLQKKRTCLLQTKEIYSAAKKLDMNSAEDINVVVRPWIQIDGLINRRSLEQMLGAVLGHCLLYPGISLVKVQERFLPALQPYHTRELVEVLVKLGSLEIKVLEKGSSNLFSTSTSIRLNKPIISSGESEYDSEIILEPTVGAIVRFATFMKKNHDRL